MATKRISKSTLSKFLRTECDRALFLSLFKDTELKSNNMPVPLQARPGIGNLKDAGIDFEDKRNGQLIKAFAGQVIFKPERLNRNKPATAPLFDLLNKVETLPSVILQGKFEPALFHNAAMANIGLNQSQTEQIPLIAGLIPDIIIARPAEPEDKEIYKDGSRKPIDLKTDKRTALSIIDIKHTGEANPSYSAEVALYAFFLSNWIENQGLHNKYFVAEKNYLWTRFKQGQSAFDGLLSNTAPSTKQQYLDALISDSEDVNLRFYLPTVLRFFREVLLNVIRIGDASVDGWKNLEWHVDGRCSACDWLGNEKWANKDDKEMIVNNPMHYCYSAANFIGHLSRIPDLTRGARKTLLNNGVNNISSAAVVQAEHPAFQHHSYLKKEKNRIPKRAYSIINTSTNIDKLAVIADLAPYPKLHLAITVNFDPSAGLLTGLSVIGRVTTYSKVQKPKVFNAKSFVVDQKNLDEEWISLLGFLSNLSDIITQADKFIQEVENNSLTAQIAFWEKRQYEELCNAMGRHLPKVLALSDQKTRALAWLFPADELIEKPDGAVSPCIVFIDEIIRRVVFTPTPHVITLFDTAENYYPDYYKSPVTQSDSYYREFLTNGIPRERIYEVWSGATTITRGSVTLPRNTVIHDISNALEKQSRALNSIVERLRSDFKEQLKTIAPKLDLSMSSGTRGVAFDSKLWIRWEELQYATKKLESKQRLTLDADTLEANYEAIRLTNGKQHTNNAQNQYIFDVLPGSTEAKLDNGEGYLALGKDGMPGLPLQRPKDILLNTAQPYSGDQSNLNMPLWSVLSVKLISFDRYNKKAVLELTSQDSNFFHYLLANGSIDLLNNIFVIKGSGVFKWYEIVTKILRAVGNPHIAIADENAVAAMGIKRPRPGTDPVTPIANILWNAGSVHNTSIIPNASAASISAYAKTKHNLNQSQADAITHAAEKGLTVIWGPPGTGKTLTLAGCIHGLIHDATANNNSLKILVTGPTYKAVEEIISRTINYLNNDPACKAEMFVGYSRSQVPKQCPTTNSNISATSFNLEQNNQDTINCLSSLTNVDVNTIVATPTMQPYKFAEWISEGNCISPIFDVVIIDESSQVQVTTAISSLSTLKKNQGLLSPETICKCRLLWL